MAKPNAPSPAPPPTPWGTLEDLLLAFAVNRHGPAAWDSIASELRKRSADPSMALTPQNCRLKYLDLKRRFAAAPNHDLNDDDYKSGAAPLLEELRKLRVAELRREVQRYDLNIESLELKVKKMEEEREQSLREETESDLEKKSQRNIFAEPESEPEPAPAGERVAGEEVEKDQISVNESNSTDLGAEKLKIGEKGPEPVRTAEDDEAQDRTGKLSEEPAELKSEPDQKLIPEDSCNGSSNSIEEPDRKVKGEPINDTAGFIEPDTESEGGEDTTKENSDVQSSVSRSRKKKGNVMVRREKTGGDEREREDQSHAVKDLSTESQPLIEFLQSIRAHKVGSVFQRRLRSQETSKYQKLVLQHIDFETIETRLKEGWYSGSDSKFFRDLLLLINNALIFFAKKSAEAKAATEIRQLISKEISQKHAKSNSSASRKQVSLKSLSMSKKDEPEPPESLTLKPRISNSLIVCRKRSSIAAKATATDKKKEEKDTKQHSQQSGSSDEPKITKKRTRDRFSSIPIPANTKKNGKSQSNNTHKNSVSDSRKQQGKGGSSSSSQPAEPKSENKKNQSSTLESKKRGAANFLNRMKQSLSPSNNGTLVDALKNRPLTSESTTTSSKGGGSSEMKKNENAKRNEKKEAAASKARQAKAKEKEKEKEKEKKREKDKEKEKSSPGKRNVGRPPKRGAAAAVPSPVLGKRVREKAVDEAEAETPPPKLAKKRTRKL